MPALSFTLSLTPFSKVMRSAQPPPTLDASLVRYLKPRLKKLGIVWVPSNMLKALKSRGIPADLLESLEELLVAAERLGWELPSSLVEDLDNVIEDIESFNPAYRAMLSKRAAEAKKGTVISQEELKLRLGLSR